MTQVHVQLHDVAERVADGVLPTWTLHLLTEILASFLTARGQTKYLNDAA